MDGPRLAPFEERTPNNDLLHLLLAYPDWERVDLKYGKVRCVICATCEGLTKASFEHPCEDCQGLGYQELRAPWVNAEAAWVLERPNFDYMLMYFPTAYQGPWLHISMYGEPQERWSFNEVTLSCPRSINAASTSFRKEGQVGGSAIPKIPENLTGFVYRTSSVQYGDCFVRPMVDIITYMESIVEVRGLLNGETLPT